ncbi:YPDG domain-containing protein [Corynebacterium caspium]|uniref:YPDG domain-containing protein n=1 Tax=Corynebacterium caspium TaxID=234828 RepID=UPI0003745840|nr:YPDG domain-containing protein [Corynebacterium caspium]WKD60040.1 C protein alpha-antigen precursor [Corynebacterium caspium DSM 44850]
MRISSKGIAGSARRRGISIAAGALTVTLAMTLQTAPFVQNTPFTAVANAQVVGNAPSVAGAIRADGVENQTQSYSGQVWFDRIGSMAVYNKPSDEPMPNVTVYLQYMESGGWVSPVYYTVSDSEGKFTFDLSKPITDALGNEHSFTLAGAPNLRIRTWMDNPDPTRFSVVRPGDTASGRFHTRLERTNESWDFTAGVNRVVNSMMVLQERPNYQGWLAKPEKDWTRPETTDGVWPFKGIYGSVTDSQVWWENWETPGSIAGTYVKGRWDRAADVELVASYVNDEVARRFKKWEADNKGFTREQQRVEQKRIVDEYNAEFGPGAAIAETVVGKADGNGKFYLPFKGLWGSSYSSKGNRRVSDEEWGKLADDYRNDTLLGVWNGGLIDKNRHINSEYMYIYPIVSPTTDVWMSTFTDNMFQDPQRTIGAGNLGASSNTKPLGQVINFQNFALITSSPQHTIINYDTEKTPAKPGDVAHTTTVGLTPNSTFVIRWAKDGQVIEGTDCTIQTDGKGDAKTCDFTIPENLDKPAIFTSQVYAYDYASNVATGSPIIADSLLAIPLNTADKVEPAYEAKDVARGTAVSSDPTFTNVKDKQPTATPKDTVFTLPDGHDPKASIDQATGKVTYTTDGTEAAGSVIDVPVTVTYPDQSKDMAKAVFTITDNQADTFTPAYEAGTSKPGDTIKLPVKFTNKDGQDATKPDNAIFKITGDAAPEGVSIDENTGEITVTVPDTKKAGDVIEIPVEVTYPDGSKDTVQARVTVAAKFADNLTPAYAEVSGAHGTTAVSKTPTFTDAQNGTVAAPQGTRYLAQTPDVNTVVDFETGVVSYKIPADTEAGTTLTIPVKVAYPDNSEDVVNVTIQVTETMADMFAPEYAPETVAPGTSAIFTKPIIKNGAGQTVDIPKDTKFALGENAPEGLNINVNPDSGTIGVDVPDDKVDGDVITIPVDVTYSDGTKDTVNATVNVKETDKAKYQPQYEHIGAARGTTAKVPEPTFTGKNNADIPRPGNVKFSLLAGHPDGVTINEGTGALSVPVDANADLSKDITIPVIVEYEDGTIDEVNAVITPQPSHADNLQPVYPAASGKPGETVEVTPDLLDNVNNKVQIPANTKFATTGVVPPGVTVNPDTGVVTAEIDNNKTSGEEIKVMVEVTYPDGTKDTVEVTVTVADKDAAKFQPVYAPVEAKRGTTATVEAPTFTTQDGAAAPNQPAVKMYRKGDGAPAEVTVDEKTGKITYPIPAEATLGQAIEIPVEVEYEDGSVDKVNAMVTPLKSDADTLEPTYPAGVGKAGETVTVTPKLNHETDGPVEIPNNTKFTTTGNVPDGVSVDPDTGVVTAIIDGNKNPGDEIKVMIDVTYPDGTKDTVEVTVTVADKDAAKFVPVYAPVEAPRGTTVQIAEPKFTDNDGKDVADKPAVKSYVKGANAPEGVTVNETTGAITFDIPAKADLDTPISIPVTVTYVDGSVDEVMATVTPKKNKADELQPNYTSPDAIPGADVTIPAPKFTDEAGGPVDVPENTTFKIPVDAAPENVAINEKTGEITLTVPADKAAGETVKVPVEVTYPDGTKETVEVTVNVIAAPKTSENVEPAYVNKEAPRGTTVTIDEPKFTDTKTGAETPRPDKANFTKGDKAPAGVEVDPTTGAITFPIPAEADLDTPIEIPVTVTYEDGSMDNVTVTVTPKRNNADSFQTVYPPVAGKPGTAAKVPAPTIKDNQNNDVENPPKLTYGKTDKTPDGVVIDENTGEITVPIPDNAKPGDSITVPVEVTYPDGSKETVEVIVGVLPKDADFFQPAYAPIAGKRGTTVAVAPPVFNDADGRPTTEKPAVKSYDKTDGTPANVTVDPTTGALQVPVAPDADPATPIQVPVLITYEDGSSEVATATVNPVNNTADELQPTYPATNGTAGETVTVTPKITKTDGSPADLPADTKFTPNGQLPDGVTVNPDTGEVTVVIPDDKQPGDEIKAMVDVTYPDGSKDTVEVTVVVSPKDAQKFEPAYKETEGVRGSEVVIPSPEYTDKDGQKVNPPADVTYTKGDNAPEGVTVDPKTGEITVPISKDAPIDQPVTIPVVVTYPDQSTDKVTATVTPKANTADTVEPTYPGADGKPGETIKVPGPSFTDKDGGKVDVPADTTFTPNGQLPDGVTIDEKTGEITVVVPDDKQPGDEIKVMVDVNYPDGSKDTVEVTVVVTATDADKLEPSYAPAEGTPGTTVKVDEPTFTDKDGKEVPKPDNTTFKKGDNAPEGVVVDPATGAITVPIAADADPTKPITFPVVVTYPDKSEEVVTVTVNVGKTQAQTIDPMWEDGKGQPGTDVVIPNTGDALPKDTTGTVTDADGNVIGEIAPDGTLTVHIPANATPGAPIKVNVELTYPDGSKETVTTTINVGNHPDWADTSAQPGMQVTVPNTGGPVLPGTTAEVKDGGDAVVTIDDQGNLVITPNKDAVPGSKITVEIKDPNGVVIDTVVITIADPAKPGISDKCIQTSLGIGLPLLFLAPLGLAAQVHIPGVSDVQFKIQTQIGQLNEQFQRDLGIFNPQLAKWASEVNAMLGTPQVRRAAGAVGVVLAGLLAGGLLLDACLPGGISGDRDPQLPLDPNDPMNPALPLPGEVPGDAAAPADPADPAAPAPAAPAAPEADAADAADADAAPADPAAPAAPEAPEANAPAAPNAPADAADQPVAAAEDPDAEA